MSKWVDYDAIDYRNDRLHDKSEEFLNGVIYMAQRIEEAPSIDIEPKHGEWIDRGMRVPSSWVKKCSLCGHETDTWRWCKFCPNCGAKMSNASNASNTLETLETLEKGETE